MCDILIYFAQMQVPCVRRLPSCLFSLEIYLSPAKAYQTPNDWHTCIQRLDCGPCVLVENVVYVAFTTCAAESLLCCIQK